MGPARRGRGERSGRQTSRHQKPRYEAARLQDSADEFEPQVEEAEVNDVVSDEESSEDEAPVKKQDAYTALLQSFGQTAPAEEPMRKKRKLNADATTISKKEHGTSNGHADQNGFAPSGDQTLTEDLAEEGADDEDNEEGADEDEDVSDAFAMHFANVDDNELSRRLKQITEEGWKPHTFIQAEGKWTVTKVSSVGHDKRPGRFEHEFSDPSTSIIKQKLSSKAKEVLGALSDTEKAYASATLDYKDVLFAARTVPNSTNLRNATCLHALNHIFKTRDRVVKNNAKLAKDAEQDFRDQGFTRPKVLILLPTRQSCVRYINSIVNICQPEQQENRKRFEDSYVANEDMDMDRPDDYKELFAGNNDDMFRIGVKFTRKTVKFFSQFYNSDLIIASPLGLRQALSGKKTDSDFLSSVEVMILDHADALLMQNWDHVLHVMEHLNQQPKEAHGCDFGRVRMWYLEGQAKYLRQTILLSSHMTPQHHALFAMHCKNIAGLATYSRNYTGAILQPQSMGIKQTFLRFPSPTLPGDPEARFKHFTSALLPSVTKMPRNPDGSGLGLLIYIPDSLDFPRLRNHFSFHPSCVNISFGVVDENHEPASKEVRRARSHFETGRHSVLLYTERAHHFFRYKLRGVRKVICYGAPTNPKFYEEVCDFVWDGGEGDVKCMYSRWERLALERVVGNERVGRMGREKGGDVFEFV